MFPKFYQEIQDYCSAFSVPTNEKLHQLERETYLKTLAPQMLTGPLQASFLQMMIKLHKARYILEVGTFTGYGALAMASVLPEGGVVDTIEFNPEYRYFHEKYFVGELESKINVLWGDAIQIMPSLTKSYDLIYIDAGKRDYAFYLEQAIKLTNSGGIIIADNVLWSGKVLNKIKDEDTSAIHDFNQKIQSREEISTSMIVPLRDGLHLMIRR